MVPVHFSSLGALTRPLVLDINGDGVQVIHHGLPAHSLPGPSWDNKRTDLELALGTNGGNYKDCTCQGEAQLFLHISLAADIVWSFLLLLP